MRRFPLAAGNRRRDVQRAIVAFDCIVVSAMTLTVPADGRSRQAFLP